MKTKTLVRAGFVAAIIFCIYPALLRADPVEVVKTIRQDGTGDFTSLAAWAAAKGGVAGGNLVAANAIAVARIEGAWTSADTAAVNLFGFTTDPSCYVRIYTAPEARHRGTAGSGYRLVTAATFNCSVTHARIEGLEIQCTGAPTVLLVRTNTGSGIGDVRISHNLIHGNGSTTNYGIEFYAYAGDARVSNNLIYDVAAVGYTAAIGLGNGLNYVYNNTIASTIAGFGVRNSGSTSARTYARNNLVNSTGAGFYGVFSSGCDYNACSGTVSTKGPHDRTGVTFNFVDAAGRNYHLAATDTGARDRGMNLRNDPDLPLQDDLDGQPRYGVWDIGADEYFTGIPSDTTPPTVPGTPSAVTVTAASVKITWLASTDDTGVSGYRIYRNGIDIGTSVTASYTDTTTVGITDFAYRVTAYDATGNESAPSGIRQLTTPPPADSQGPWIVVPKAVSKWPDPVVITWVTDEPSTSQVEYGPDASYGNLSTLQTELGLNHRVVIPLSADGTTGHYRIRSRDSAGNETISQDYTFIVNSSLGRTLYLDNQHPSSSDSNPGTESLPWKTFQYAVDSARPGDTIIVKPGSYERVTIKRGGSPGNWITLRGHAPVSTAHVDFTAIFDPANPVQMPGNPALNAVCRGFAFAPTYGSSTPVSHVRIENFEITAIHQVGQTFSSIGGIYLFGQNPAALTESVEIVGNFLHDINPVGYSYVAIRGDNPHTRNILIQNNRIFRCQGTGISLHGSHWLVEGNDVSHTLDAHTGTGVMVGGDSDTCRFFGHHQIIRNNYFHDCLEEEQAGGPHIDAFQTFSVSPSSQYAYDILIEQNTCVNTGQMMMLEDQAEDAGTANAVHDLIIRNNLFVGARAFALQILVDRVTLVNNVIAFSSLGPIACNTVGANHVFIANNIFYRNGSGPIASVPDMVSDYNLTYPDFTNPPRNPELDKHSLFGLDPQFVNPAALDYRLQPTSPAINAGVSLRTVWNDRLGILRPQGAGIDIGPYEFVIPVLDSDGDGLVDSWEIQYFGSISDPRALPDLDVDGDGMSNLSEQTAGTIPIDSMSVLRITAQSLSEILGFTLTWQSIPNRTYVVESSGTLTNWIPAASVDSTSNSTSWTDSSATGVRKFYRVKIP